MLTPDDLQRYFLGLLGRVCEPLHDHLDTALGRARDHFAQYDIDVMGGWQLTHLVRAHTDDLLQRDPLPGFTVCEPRQNGRLLLAAADGSTLRLLHAPPGRGVPPPGRNRARVRYWQQQQLVLPFENEAASNLLLLWSVDAAGVSQARAVRPIGKWRYGAKAKIDLDFLLPRTAAGMEELEFRPDDTDLELQVPDPEAISDDFGLEMP